MRRAAAHTKRSHTCRCGKTIKGNGYKAHKLTCAAVLKHLRETDEGRYRDHMVKVHAAGRHDWDYTANEPWCLGGIKARKCRACDTRQTYSSDQVWGRVVGYSWGGV